jgi:hypothetical protein
MIATSTKKRPATGQAGITPEASKLFYSLDCLTTNRGYRTKIRILDAHFGEAELLPGDGAPGESRTPDLLVRSQTLYPAELRAHPF